MGHGSVIFPGDIQKMSAGTGVKHSEFNHAPQLAHFLQIWIKPHQRGVVPDYQQKSIPADHKRGQLALLVGPQGSGAPVTLHQDALLYAGLFTGDERLTLPLSAQRLIYVHLAQGQLSVNGEQLRAGDALKLTHETLLHITHQSEIKSTNIELN
jgi:quercetin 2,3-dioxygenase